MYEEDWYEEAEHDFYDWDRYETDDNYEDYYDGNTLQDQEVGAPDSDEFFYDSDYGDEDLYLYHYGPERNDIDEFYGF